MTCPKSLTMFPTLTHSPSASLTSLLLRPHQVSSCLRTFTLTAASSRTCASGATFILQLLQVTFFEVIVNLLPLAITVYLPSLFQLLPAKIKSKHSGSEGGLLAPYTECILVSPGKASQPT